MDENFSRLAVDWQVEENVFVYCVVVKQIMGAELVKPDHFTSVCIASENSGGKLVVPGARVGVPRPRIRGTVINEVEFGIIRNPSPCAAATNFPCIRRPGFYAEV